MRGKIAGWLLVMSFTLRAGAEEPFPGGMQEAAGIPCTPTCLLCHTAIPGTRANLQQPFGLTVFRSGKVKPGKPESMHDVVAYLRDMKIDTDSDGKLDVDELAVGSDPNFADPNKEVCGPQYGCGAHLAPVPPRGPKPVLWWLVAALSLASLVVARRSRSTE